MAIFCAGVSVPANTFAFCSSSEIDNNVSVLVDIRENSCLKGILLFYSLKTPDNLEFILLLLYPELSYI
jgi:hypothetical protein